MEKYSFPTISAGSWLEVKQTLDERPPGWAFRGQADSAWPLQTSLERVAGDWRPAALDLARVMLPQAESALTHAEPDLAAVQMFLTQLAPDVIDMAFDGVLEIEQSCLAAFRSRAHHFLSSNLLPRNLLEWMALMQHHGSPTRLLDWTLSPYIAAYFAVEDCADSCAIWAIDVEWFNLRGRLVVPGLVRKRGGRTSKVFSSAHYFQRIVDQGITGVFPVRPEHLNERLTTQQGLFVALGNTKLSFMDNLEPYRDELQDHLLKLEVPRSVRSEALAELNRMNINRATLFPGIDGFAQSIRYQIMLDYDTAMAMKAFDRVMNTPGSLNSFLQIAAAKFFGSAGQLEQTLRLAEARGFLSPEQGEQIRTELLGKQEEPDEHER